MVLAINGAAQGERRQMIGWLIVTLALGWAFLGVKGYEYFQDFQDKVVPLVHFEPKPVKARKASCSGSSTGSRQGCTRFI
jgi:cytochrome c oxidase subunit 3